MFEEFYLSVERNRIFTNPYKNHFSKRSNIIYRKNIVIAILSTQSKHTYKKSKLNKNKV